MLIIPYQTKFTAKSLPLATLVLIALNVLVFFLFQARDDKAYDAAYSFYEQSQLPAIELPRYRTWLQQRGDSDARERLKLLQLADEEESRNQFYIQLMQSDTDFMRELHALRVIKIGDQDFANWREQRRLFDEKLRTIFTERFLFSPEESSEWWRYLTHQFLHGDFGHLLGNMIVLLVAGPFAEAALGRLRFALAYLISGGIAAAINGVFVSQGLVGASGAISGAMAMVAVLYWTRRVPVFYWIVFYFDTARIPALALLPIWIGNEIYQWISTPGSHVAYGAHLGGFLAGTAIAWILRPRDARKVDRILEHEFADERKQHKRSSLLQQAQEAASRLDTRRAARLYRELVETHPEQVEYQLAYFNIALLGQDKDSLGDAALRLLWSRAKSHADEFRKAFLAMSQPKVSQLLPVDEQLRLARRLVRVREDSSALRLLDGLLSDDNLRTLYARQIADCLLGVFTTYTRLSLRAQADQARSRLEKYFPASETAGVALGGAEPSREPPASIRSTRGPVTLRMDLK